MSVNGGKDDLPRFFIHLHFKPRAGHEVEFATNSVGEFNCVVGFEDCFHTCHPDYRIAQLEEYQKLNS